jgi:hypothetical protein
VAAAARGKWRGKRCAGQHATLRDALGSKEARGVAGRRRVRAECELTAVAAMAGGGARDGALRGEGSAFIGALALGDDG